MTSTEALIVVAVIAGATLLTRALPFILFPANRQTPGIVAYLGRVLPYAVIGMLVVYCLKDIRADRAPYGAPEALGVLATAGLYLWRKNALLAISGGTAAYMLLLRFAFA